MYLFEEAACNYVQLVFTYLLLPAKVEVKTRNDLELLYIQTVLTKMLQQFRWSGENINRLALPALVCF